MMKLLLPLAAFILLSPQDKAKTKLAWNLPKGRVWEYKLLDKAGKPQKDGGFWIFSSELGGDGSNRLVIDRYADIPLYFLFSLPKDEKKPGEGWEASAFFFYESAEALSGWGFGFGGGGAVKPVCAKGVYRFLKLEKKADGDIAHLTGVFELFEIRRDFVNNERKLTVTKNKLGTVATDALFNVSTGVLQRGMWSISTRSQERIAEKNSPDTTIVDRKLDAAGGIEFSEEVELKREKMEKAAGDQVKKAVEWLKKQQRPAGDFGFGPATESMRIECVLAGLVVRALLAAGIKPDDPILEKAMKTVRAAPGTSTMSIAQALLAIVLRTPGEDRDAISKAFAKDDLTALKALTAVLLGRRDSKLGAFPTTDEKDATFNPISTAHAAEALWAGGLVGNDAPGDVWKNIVETLSTASCDDDAASLELKIEFADGFGFPIADGAKQAKPVTYRYDLRAKPSNDPKQNVRGWGLTLTAALEILKLAQIELERKKQLTDIQKRSIDGMQRTGLAWIQAHYTWRASPPPEAAWTVRRIEFAAAVGRVLTMYGVKSIDGNDWWVEGAYHLLRVQAADGSWEEGTGSAIAETANAILFLTRSWPSVK